MQRSPDIIAHQRIEDWLTYSKPTDHLDLSNLGLTSLPAGIPDTVEKLSISKNPITTIDAYYLPHNLKMLEATDCELIEIPDDLPDSIQLLCLNRNKIKKIPKKLPNNLVSIYAISNNIHEIPETLPERIRYVVLSCNNISELPSYFPPSMIWLDVINNPLPIDQTYFECHQSPLKSYIVQIQNMQVEAVRERQQCRTAIIKQELMEVTWHPARIARQIEAGVDIDCL